MFRLVIDNALLRSSLAILFSTAIFLISNPIEKGLYEYFELGSTLGKVDGCVFFPVVP